MSSVRAWLQAARPLAQVNIAVPILLGEALAYATTGTVHVWMLVVAHVIGIVDQLFIVFANDVADEEGDRANVTFNAFSGGSRVLSEGKLTRRALERAAGGMALVMLLLCVWAGLVFDRPWLVGFWAVAVALLWAYSYAPARLAYRGWGEAAQGLGLGVVLPMLGWYAQLGSFVDFPWLVVIPAFLVGLAGNITTALPDAPADAAVDKHTWPVRFGPARARKHSVQLLAIATLLTPLVLPGASRAVLAAVEVVPALALLLNLRGLRSADAERREACRRFVILNGAAIHALLLGWSAVAVVHPQALVGA